MQVDPQAILDLICGPNVDSIPMVDSIAIVDPMSIVDFIPMRTVPIMYRLISFDAGP